MDNVSPCLCERDGQTILGLPGVDDSLELHSSDGYTTERRLELQTSRDTSSLLTLSKAHQVIWLLSFSVPDTLGSRGKARPKASHEALWIASTQPFSKM